MEGRPVGKYVRPELMTNDEIQAQIVQAFQQWNYIACNGCSDPNWPDGANMNLIRNHIINWYRLLDERRVADAQTSLFDCHVADATRRPVPPEVPDQYMVAGCKYSSRLAGRTLHALVWGQKGEYQA